METEVGVGGIRVVQGAQNTGERGEVWKGRRPDRLWGRGVGFWSIDDGSPQVRNQLLTDWLWTQS